jgi:hypothetical protein
VLLAAFHRNTNKNANDVLRKIINYVQQTKWNRQFGITFKT